MKLTPGIEKTIAGFYNLFTVDEWQEAKTSELASTIGVKATDINFARRVLIEQGSLEYTMDKNPREGTAKASYRLVDSPEVAAQKIANNPTPTISHWRADHGESSLYSRGVLKPWKQDETVWVAEEEPPVVVVEIEPKPADPKPVTLTRALGDLSPLRKDEPRALVEAARQYLHRWEIAHQHAVALVEAGLAESTDFVMGMLKLDRRDDFDAIALVLPYIDSLEHRIANLEKYQNTLRDKAVKAEEMEVQIRRLKDQNTRLIAATVNHD